MVRGGERRCRAVRATVRPVSGHGDALPAPNEGFRRVGVCAAPKSHRKTSTVGFASPLQP